MGTCFGLCKRRSKSKRLHRCIYSHGTDEIELELLVDGETEEGEDVLSSKNVWTMTGRIPSAVSSRIRKVSSDLRNVKHYSENLSKEDEKENDYVDESQLIPLDAHTLLAARAVQRRTTSFSSSTPPSSVDLEWETEGALLGTVYRFKSLPTSSVDDGSSCSGGGAGGGGGSPESLEWDPCEQATMDLETEQLINEIEQLTHKALEETGVWSNR
ncbi:uncharacterized protein isoform X2 [Rhodnius prolixus]|uniref:uncharacterized protein isoform X2 n=1 Tax=Rhodnius prolixus TaxID=13249 RepID=UPI003D187D15